MTIDNRHHMSIKLVSTGIAELLPMQRTGDPNNHISAVIRSLCVRLGHFEAVDPDDTVSEQTRTLWELGHAFERAVSRALCERCQESDPRRYCVPGEVELDGLIGSPDLLDLGPAGDTLLVEEMKLTKLSSRHDVEGEKFWKYWVQLKAYCHMFGTRRGQLHVCHLNGDYRDDRGPTYNRWEATFSDQELFENWRMLVTHRRGMV